MKTQCTFTFFGQEYKCVRESRPDDLGFGGEFDISNRRVSINESYDKETFCNYVFHELLESGIFLSACTFTRLFPDRKDIFVMDHAQMDVISGAVCGAYDTIKQKMFTKNDDEKVIKDKLNKKKLEKKELIRKKKLKT